MTILTIVGTQHMPFWLSASHCARYRQHQLCDPAQLDSDHDCSRARSCAPRAASHGRHDWGHARCDVLEYCGTRSNVVEYVQLEKKRPHIMITFTAQIKYVVAPRVTGPLNQ